MYTALLAVHREALHLIERGALAMGLDASKLMEVVHERLDAGRNVESHHLGGIPGVEAAVTDEELHRLQRAGTQILVDPATVAAHARLKRGSRSYHSPCRRAERLS